MTTQNSKTIISYSGGSAGDMFTLSCNGEKIDVLTGIRVSQPATLKDYEHRIRIGESANLLEELNKIPYQFVNTHMLDEVVDREATVYNIVMANKEVQLATVYRQMQIQKLRMEVDTNKHSWYYVIKGYVDNKDYQAAAEYWLDNAMKHWLDRMDYRLNFTNASVLNFDKLYTDDFVDDLLKQGWHHHIPLLRYNHAIWLKKNKQFTREKTIESMKQKISSMDWDQTEGWISYSPN